MVENKVCLPFETRFGYCFAKMRICVKCPVPLTPIHVIQRMVFGLYSSAYKAAVLSKNPTSVELYYDLIRCLDEASLGEIEDRNASRGGLASDSLVPEVGASSLNSFMDRMVKKITLRVSKYMSQPPPTFPIHLFFAFRVFWVATPKTIANRLRNEGVNSKEGMWLFRTLGG